MSKTRLIQPGFDALPPIAADERLIQVDCPLGVAEWLALDEVIKSAPWATLHLMRRADREDPKLDLLKYLRHVTRLRLNLPSLSSLDVLSSWPCGNPGYFGIGQTKKKLSLQPLGLFESIGTCYVEGPKQHWEFISSTAARTLILRNANIHALHDVIPPGVRELALHRLASLEIPSCRELRRLEFRRPRGSEWHAGLGGLAALEELLVEGADIGNWPDMAMCRELHTVALRDVRRVESLAGLAAAPNLRRVIVLEGDAMSAATLEPLAALDLREVYIDLVDPDQNAIARQLFPQMTDERLHVAFIDVI